MAQAAVESEDRAEEWVKAVVLLNRKDLADLQELARSKGVDFNEVLASAIATFKFFKEAEAAGNTILLQGPDRKFERVRLP